MAYPSLRLLTLLLPVALAACGSSITPAGGGAGGTSGTTASTSSSTGTVSTGSACGGPSAVPCAADQYCRFATSTPACGQWGTEGTCEPRPTGCPPDCPGVCGCDGQFYCSACAAAEAGQDTLPGDSCAVGDGTYRAISAYTNLPRFVLLKAATSRGLCFRLYASMTQSLGIGVWGGGYAVERAEATFDLADCAVPPGWPPAPLGPSVSTTAEGAGSGTLTLGQDASGQCVVGIHATVQLPPGSTSDLPLEAFQADGVEVEGGCP